MSDGTVKAKKKESVKIYSDIYTDDVTKITAKLKKMVG